MYPVGIGVITKLPYELIEITAIFDVEEYFCITYFPIYISIQIKSAALTMLRGRAAAQGTVEFWRSIPRRNVYRDFKVISERLKDMLSYKL